MVYDIIYINYPGHGYADILNNYRNKMGQFTGLMKSENKNNTNFYIKMGKYIYPILFMTTLTICNHNYCIHSEETLEEGLNIIDKL